MYKEGKKYYVYIATNHPRNTVLYTGLTSNLVKRCSQHRRKLFEGSFTDRYNINKIVYYETFGDAGMAISREKQIKRLLRSKKINLIESANPGWNDLMSNIK